MKKIITLKTIFTNFFVVLSLASFGQEGKMSNTNSDKIEKQKVTQEDISVKSTTASRIALANCTDKVNYVGNTSAYWTKFGGGPQTSSSAKPISGFMTFPSNGGAVYKGTVVGVEFDAATFLAPTNANVNVYVYNLNSNGAPSGSALGMGSIVVNGTNLTSYLVNFPNPVSVTSAFGFGIGIWAAANSDSLKLYEGPVVGTSGPNLSYLVTYTNNSLHSYSSYWGASSNNYLLIRPVISTSITSSWITAKTSTTCGAPAVYSFTNTTSSTATPTYIVNQIISPGSPIIKDLDYGDGNTSVNFPYPTSLTHTYTSLGSFVAKYDHIYTGWTNSCIDSKTISVLVDNPLPSFSYTTSGLTITLNNTSQNLASFVWNFGDLSTSTQQQPGSHTFNAPGTYVVELEGTAPCGKVRYSVSVTVPSNISGIVKGVNSTSNFISLSPNPTNSILKITNKSDENLNSKIEIFNSTGALVKTINDILFDSGDASIDVSEFSTGIYFVKFKTEKTDFVKSFIKE